MTFYEAAIRVLEAAGKPLHFQDITRQSIEQNLLSHVGKMPEETMLSRLAAMAKRPKDRRVIVTAKDTFALTDWNLLEDAAALAETGIVEPNPEELLPAMRPEERHPQPQTDIVRSTGRHERRRRFEEEERGRRRRFPPLAEVAFEALSESAEGLSVEALLSSLQSKELVGPDTVAQNLLMALLEDNQRRIDAGRRPQFICLSESGKLALESADSEVSTQERQTALAALAGIPMVDGRPQLRIERVATDVVGEQDKFHAAKLAAKEARRAMARHLRRHLGELDSGALEKAIVRLMHADGFRELKVAKRAREGALLTARRKEGSIELRYAVRLLKNQASVEKRSIQELRKDLSHYGAHAGILISTGELRSEARGEALHGGALVFVWSAEALAEKFLDARVGVRVTEIALFELEPAFFEQARLDADAARSRREERLKERQQRDLQPEATVAPVDESELEEASDDDESGSDAEQGGAEPGTAAVSTGAGERRKRRRRRRRRRSGPNAEPGVAAVSGEASAVVANASSEGALMSDPARGNETREGSESSSEAKDTEAPAASSES